MKLFKNFKETRAFKPPFSADQIYGGALLGVRSGEVTVAHDPSTNPDPNPNPNPNPNPIPNPEPEPEPEPNPNPIPNPDPNPNPNPT